MISAKKRFQLRLLIIAFIALGFPITVLAANSFYQAKTMPASTLVSVSGSLVLASASGTYSYAGMIQNISGSSITLYHGVTCIITGSTVCKAPMSGGSMMNMQTVSCSSFTKGETVQISAVKNASGQLVATEIQEVFF